MVHVMSIDRDWHEPVYAQIAAILRRQIESGELAPGRPVPSIRTLCERYGIARMTAAKALRVLATEGLIHVVAGRGWFVTPRD
jgi:DNA-binding GntR family transcriptional regulator